MTAEELYSIVSKWPEKYREVPDLEYSRILKHWFTRTNPVPAQHAAMLLCYHAEGVLMSQGKFAGSNVPGHPNGDWFVGWSTQKGETELYKYAPTRLAAIDALIRKVEGIGTN